VLGAVKSATTDLAWQLVHNGIESTIVVGSVPDNDFWSHNISDLDVPFLADKESYFVLQYMKDHFKVWNPEDAMEVWESYMPICPHTAERKIHADFTVMNLGMSAKGRSSSEGGVLAFGVDVTAFDMPSTLEHWYGQLSSRPTFIIMLREPLSQMQSLWYHARTVYHLQGDEVPRQAIGDMPMDSTFLAQLNRTLALAEAGTIPLWLWYAMYANQIEAWIDRFAAQQFFIIPMMYFVELATDEVAESLQERLQYPISFSEVHGPTESINHHEHPKLEEEVPPGMRLRFDSLLAGEHQHLLQVLQKAYLQGGHLPGFHPEGSNASLIEIEAWLTRGW